MNPPNASSAVAPGPVGAPAADAAASWLAPRAVRWLAPAAIVLAAVAWLALREVSFRLAGPPGFDVVVADTSGRALRHERARYLIAPGALSPPPPDSRFVAGAEFLARRDGEYRFALASTALARLRIDGVLLVTASPRVRPADRPLRLAAGAHRLEVEVPRVDAEGGLVLGARGPDEPWRTQPLGPGDVIAQGEPSRARIVLLPLFPWAVLLLVALGAAALLRRRLRALLATIAGDPIALRNLAALAVVAIVLPLIAPLAAPGYYACHEEESYIVRFQQFDLAMRAGVPLGRWWPDPVLGRGYPFLCFYAPLLYLLGWPLLRLGVDAVVALRVLSALGVLAGAFTIFALCRRRLSIAASLVGVALWVWAPYLHTDLWVRADLPETFGFFTFPLALLAIDRALDGTARAGAGHGAQRTLASPDVPLVALSVAALGITHAITSYFSLLFIGLWIAARLLAGAGADGLRRVIAGGLLGAAATGFYVVPTLAEHGLVRTELLTVGYYSFRKHFVPFWNALRAEPGTGPYDMRLYLGTAASVALAAAVVALLLAWRRRRRRPVDDALHAEAAWVLLVPAVAGALAALALVTPPAGALVLGILPLGRFVSFPWRLFLFAACLSSLAGAAALEMLVRRPAQRRGLALLVVAAVTAAALPRSGSPQVLLRTHLHPEQFLRANPVDYVTSMNEYLPVSVRSPAPPFDLVARLIPPDAGAIRERSRVPGEYRVRLRADAPAVVEFNAHYYPGWRARVDGADVRIGPRGAARIEADGLIRVPVGRGEHEAQIRFERTPLRLACDLVSLAAVLCCLAWLGIAARRHLLRQGARA